MPSRMSWFSALFLTATLAAADAGNTLIEQANRLIARGDFSGALELADAAPNPVLRAAAEQVRGAVARERGLPLAAATHYSQALEWAGQASNPPLVASAFRSLADLYFTQGRFDRVLEVAGRMLRSARPADPNRALYLVRSGMAYSEMQALQPAEQAFAEALPLAESIQDFSLAGEIHRQRGLWYWRYKRDLQKALHEFDEAISYGRKAR